MRRVLLPIATILSTLPGVAGCEKRTMPILPTGWRNQLDENTQRRIVHALYTTHYAETGSEEALAFLLFNGVRTGMDRAGVEKILGQTLLDAEAPDGWQPANGLEEDDEVLTIKPTSKGWTCLFHFRDGALLNYYPTAPAQAKNPVKEPVQR